MISAIFNIPPHAFNELIGILKTGNPPLITQLAILNTIYLIVIALRRVKGQHVKNPLVSQYLQFALLLANTALVAATGFQY